MKAKQIVTDEKIEDEKSKVKKYRISMKTTYSMDGDNDTLNLELRIDDDLRKLLESICIKTKKELKFDNVSTQRYLIKRFIQPFIESSWDYVMFSCDIIDNGMIALKFSSAQNLVDYMNSLRVCLKRVLQEMTLISKLCSKETVIDVLMHEKK